MFCCWFQLCVRHVLQCWKPQSTLKMPFVPSLESLSRSSFLEVLENDVCALCWGVNPGIRLIFCFCDFGSYSLLGGNSCCWLVVAIQGTRRDLMQLMEFPSVPGFCMCSQKDNMKDFWILCKEATALCTESLAEHMSAVELRKRMCRCSVMEKLLLH